MAYDVPAASDLQARYPAFADVNPDVITYWITDAQRFVSADSWSDIDYGVALLALAAHNMALEGVGADGDALAGVPAGVSSFKSGSLSVNFTPEAANARMTGDLSATRYGQEYSMLLGRNVGGPRVAASGIPPYGVYPVGWPVGWP